eukprot:350688-Chlamydomonas_euryale.AAC.3
MPPPPTRPQPHGAKKVTQVIAQNDSSSRIGEPCSLAALSMRRCSRLSLPQQSDCPNQPELEIARSSLCVRQPG